MFTGHSAYPLGHTGFLFSMTLISREQLNVYFQKVLIAVLLLFAGAGADFNNYWDRPLSFTCPSGNFIRKIYSEHSNHHEDRRWD